MRFKATRNFTPPRLAGLLSAKIGGPTHRWRPWEGAVRSVASRSKWPWRESTGGVRRVARRARFIDKRTAAWARIALMWVRKRCYEPTEPPRSLETARACRNS